MDNNKHFNVFLSYSHHDTKWVQEFTSVLKTSGISTCFDVNEIDPGEKWQEAMQKALRESKTLVVFLSHNNVNSPSTLFELGAAVADNKKIIPILVEDLDISQVPLPIRTFQMLRASSPTEAGIRVAEVIQKSAKNGDVERT